MTHAYVPTGRIKRDWRVDIKTKEMYDLVLASGMMYVWYPDIPSWSEVEKQLLAYQAKVEYCRKTRDSNFEASCKLEGIE